jgi:regulator of replication initiation timing
VLDAMNAGRKDMGDKAAALCTRLADTRRQIRLLTQQLGELETQLGSLLDEAGEGVLETPAGTLRKLLDEAGRPRFILEV